MTEALNVEVQGAFRNGRGYGYQIFTLKQISEEMRRKEKILHLSFMDLQKAFDRIKGEALWQVLVIGFQ